MALAGWQVAAEKHVICASSTASWHLLFVLVVLLFDVVTVCISGQNGQPTGGVRAIRVHVYAYVASHCFDEYSTQAEMA